MMIRMVALFAFAVSTAHGLSLATVRPGNDTMSVGDGTTVKTNSSTTIFLDTEYNPNKCVLQFDSLKCTDTDCGELNGYKLECVSIGKENGKPKTQCQCKATEADVCQSPNNTVHGVPQFGDCSGGRACAESYGHVPSKLELRICAERLHCVKEVNTSASVKAEICHTCRSCIAQNDETSAKLSDNRRFDCRKICPPEILESLEKRNKKGLGIADEFGSDSSSGSNSGSGSGSNGNTGSKAKGKSKSDQANSATVLTFVGSFVGAILSMVVLI